MPAPTINDPAADPQLQRYYDQLDLLAGQAIDGQIDETTFRERVVRLTVAAALLMFLLGGGQLGSPAATAVIAEQNRIARQSAAKLASDIFSGKYSAVTEGGKVIRTAAEGREMLQTRLGLWGNTMANVYASGQLDKPATPQIAPDGTTAVTEPSFTWRLGNTEVHCTDCAALDGQTMTVSEWKAAGIQPQSPDLECGGWRCDCRLEVA